jgi:hypothetical protein
MLPKTIFLIGLGSLMLASPVPLEAWRVKESKLVAMPLPASFQPVPEMMGGDLDEDGAAEAIVQADHHVSIQSGGVIRWASPEPWNVQQAVIADVNGDGRPEAILLVSRPFRAWPVDAWLPSGGRIDGFHDKSGFSSHIILIGWDGRHFREKWAGSALAEPVASMAVASFDNTTFLITLEKQYDDPAYGPARWLKVWDWNGFGFSVVTSLNGPFTRLAVVQAGGEPFLILE